MRFLKCFVSFLIILISKLTLNNFIIKIIIIFDNKIDPKTIINCFFLWSMHIGKYIKVARISIDMTQQELADKVYKTRPLISSIEQTGKVNELTLRKICEVLEVDMDDLLQKTKDPSTQYTSIKKANNDVLSENKSLKEENQRLKELVDSQREIIELLKEKYKGK